MSSSPPPKQHRPRRFLPSSLRGKLIAQLIVLLALVCVVVGVVTEVALSQFLIRQLDTQLSAAAERGNHTPPPGVAPGRPDLPPTDLIRVPGQGPGTLGVEIRPDGSVRSGVIPS